MTPKLQSAIQAIAEHPRPEVRFATMTGFLCDLSQDNSEDGLFEAAYQAGLSLARNNTSGVRQIWADEDALLALDYGDLPEDFPIVDMARDMALLADADGRRLALSMAAYRFTTNYNDEDFHPVVADLQWALRLLFGEEAISVQGIYGTTAEPHAPLFPTMNYLHSPLDQNLASASSPYRTSPGAVGTAANESNAH